MENLRGIAIGGAATLVIIGGIVYTQFDDWFSPEPTGPGSGDEMPYEPEGPGSGDELPGPDEPGPGSGDEASVVGSCNVINDSSVCTDYIGSFWTTPAIEEANCDGVGVYTKNLPCPQPTSGGCQMSAGADYEMIAWYYPYGGDPIVGDLIGYAAGACNGSGGNYLFNN